MSTLADARFSDTSKIHEPQRFYRRLLTTRSNVIEKAVSRLLSFFPYPLYRNIVGVFNVYSNYAKVYS